MSQVNDVMATKMLTYIKLSTPLFPYEDLNDIIYQWLKANLGLSSSVHSTIDDLWELFFDASGIATGARNDRYSAWLTSLGFTGSLQDQKLGYWSTPAPIGDWILENGIWDDTGVWDDTAVWKDSP